jgi:amino acid transporter
VPRLATAAKRLVLGLPFRSDELSDTLLRKRIALPVFASDALSSVAYAPQEVLVTLSLAGLGAYVFSPWIGVAVVLVLATVVVSYRQNVHAYPSGGGDYEIATVNLGRYAGLTVGSALLVDYTLTVAVSMSSAADNLGALIPFVGTHKVLFCVAAIVVLTAVNLRGVRESGIAFAVPTYLFIFSLVAMLVVGAVRLGIGADMTAPSAAVGVVGEETQLSQFALMFLVLRSFTQGCAALTGVEAISNGVPAFRKPKSRNAATTLAMLGLIAICLFSGMLALARATGVHMAEDPDTQLVNAPPGYKQETLIAQLAQTIFHGFPPGFWAVTIFTALILVLAANTAFNGFPVLGSILAQDRYLPRQLHTRGDRLAFSNGILFLAFFAIVLVVGFGAQVTALIPLYTVGVFVSFTLSQTGMVRHWNRLLRTETGEGERRRLHRARLVSGFGATMTGVVLVVVLITKFMVGAWIAIVAGALAFALMLSIRKHYDRVAEEIAAPDGVLEGVLPSRNHAIVLVSTVHKPTLRAVAYARATRPDVLEAVTVNVDDADTRKVVTDWEARQLPVPLKVLESPYREITRPILQYVKRIRTDNPRDVVTVFIPEYVLGRWWEQVLHNQSALRLKGRLLFQKGVMVVSVPWQLESSARAAARRPPAAPGSARRGYEAPLPGAGGAGPRRDSSATGAVPPLRPGSGRTTSPKDPAGPDGAPPRPGADVR